MSNLIPLNKRTKDEQRRIASAGGKASGRARADKKRMRDILECLMDKKGENGAYYREEICLALIQKALTGDVRAFETIRDTLGENPTFLQEHAAPDLPPPTIIVQPVAPASRKDIEP